jgi:cystinosin
MVSSAGDWSGVTGDVVKFLLGLVSVGFDVLFMLQHFLWFPARRVDNVGEDSDRAPLTSS